MKIVVTGACGFAGSAIISGLLEARAGLKIVPVDNLSRPGSEVNRRALPKLGLRLRHVDIRMASDVAALERADWVIDAAANPSVLAGVTEGVTSRQVIEHNLIGTINLLEYCKAHRAGFTLLSTSRVYSIAELARLKLTTKANAFKPVAQKVRGLTSAGVSEQFSTNPPVSLYGAAKYASEQLALEYGETFGFKVYINRCGVLAAAGQFGKADQGIFAFWIHSYKWKKPLRYLGFDGRGHQVRDCLHPRDLVSVLLKQMSANKGPTVCNFGGGIRSSMSLRQLNDWCADRWGAHKIAKGREKRPFDVPWLVLDSGQAARQWGWRPQTNRESILEEIAQHAEEHPDWLEISC
jgi:CDP-paratose 2-epimerase